MGTINIDRSHFTAVGLIWSTPVYLKQVVYHLFIGNAFYHLPGNIWLIRNSKILQNNPDRKAKALGPEILRLTSDF